MPPNTAPILFKKAQVCQRLNMSARTLEGKVKDGLFPEPVRMGKYVYWCEAAIEAWLTREFGPQIQWKP
jgi:predicted DNA-binding transcriptional regulator AlpA